MPDTNITKDKSTEKKKGWIRKFFDLMNNVVIIVMSKLFPKKNKENKEGHISSSINEASETIDNQNIYENMPQYRKNSIYSSVEENIYEEVDNNNIVNDKRNSIYSSSEEENSKQGKEDTYEEISEDIYYEYMDKYNKDSGYSSTEENKITPTVENNKQVDKHSQLQAEKVTSTEDKYTHLTGEKLVEAKFKEHLEERKKERSQKLENAKKEGYISGPIDGALYATVNKQNRSQSESKQEGIRNQDKPTEGVKKKNDIYPRPTDQYNKFTNKIEEKRYNNKDNPNSIA